METYHEHDARIADAILKAEHDAVLDQMWDVTLPGKDADKVRIISQPDVVAVHAQNSQRRATVAMSPEQAIKFAVELMKAANAAMGATL